MPALSLRLMRGATTGCRRMQVYRKCKTTPYLNFLWVIILDVDAPGLIAGYMSLELVQPVASPAVNKIQYQLRKLFWSRPLELPLECAARRCTTASAVFAAHTYLA